MLFSFSRPRLLRLRGVRVRRGLERRRVPVPGGMQPVEEEEQRAVQEPAGGGVL